MVCLFDEFFTGALSAFRFTLVYDVYHRARHLATLFHDKLEFRRADRDVGAHLVFGRRISGTRKPQIAGISKRGRRTSSETAQRG